MRYAQVVVLSVDGALQQFENAEYVVTRTGALEVENDATAACWAPGQWRRVTAVRKGTQ